MNNNRLPLDVIQVAEPCAESWERMSGDDRVRYCVGCRKHVYNLSAMTRTDAERLVCEGAGGLCVRYTRLESGQVQTLEYRAPAAGGRGWRFWAAVSTVAASIVAGANGYFIARGKPAAAPPAVILGTVPVVGLLPMLPPPPPAGGLESAPSPGDGSEDLAAG